MPARYFYGKMDRFHLTSASMNLLTRITIALLLTSFATAAHAEDELSASPAMHQVTSVAQLRDIQPTDWAFQALQSLVERHGCISGYPDKTFRGNRALTRYEFAAGMNACQDRIQDLIAASTTDAAKKEDLKTLQTLQEQFAAELTTLRGRTDVLEAKTATLEKQQFSTTTKLYGQVVLGLQGSNAIGVDLFPKDGIKELTGQANVTLGYNLQLTLATSFRGDDLLLTGFQTGNIDGTSGTLFTNMGRLASESGLNNQLVISDLSYRFALGRRHPALPRPHKIHRRGFKLFVFP